MIIPKPSPNFTVGRKGYKPEKIVIHIMDGSLIGTDSWFANPASKISANYGIGFNQEVHQYVKDEDTAYAQGVVDNPTWTYRPGVNPNLYCLSIEHEGHDLGIINELQILTSVELIKSLCAKWNIPINRQNIVGHYEIRSSKPNCPATRKEVIDIMVNMAQGEPVPILVPKDKLQKITDYLLKL